MKPTDPDFPYEIEELKCQVIVPAGYPTTAMPHLRVLNKDIPRGFQINIERGFDTIVHESRNATLLALTNRLDQRLESILAGKMANTIKITSNQDRNPKPLHSTLPEKTVPAADVNPATSTLPSAQDLEAARSRRQLDTRQLEARFSRLAAYSKSPDGLSYTLPLDSPRRSAWPESLQSIRTMRIIVPERYPLEPLELHLGSDAREAKSLQLTFADRSRQHAGDSITRQINYLTQHVADMAITTTEKVEPRPEPEPETEPSLLEPAYRTQTDHDDSHIRYIPRPPEWSKGTTSEDDDDSEDDSDEGTGDETAESGEETEAVQSTSAPAERGILLSFPHLDLYGIELLELTSLKITVKCERCKDTKDIEKLRSPPEAGNMRDDSCNKCAAGFGIRFRADLIHANSVRGGYLDLDGCTVVDMFPRYCIPSSTSSNLLTSIQQFRAYLLRVFYSISSARSGCCARRLSNGYMSRMP
jgi:hypothetical protein